MRVKLQAVLDDPAQLKALDEMRSQLARESGAEPYKSVVGEFWFVVDEKGQIIGYTGVYLLDAVSRRIRSAGTWLMPERRQQGYGREALASKCHVLFEDRNVNRVELETAVDNEAALRLVRSIGFVEEGRKRDFCYFGGKLHDFVEFSMLRSDWDALKISGNNTQSLEAV